MRPLSAVLLAAVLGMSVPAMAKPPAKTLGELSSLEGGLKGKLQTASLKTLELPPGLANRENLPPGLAKMDSLPPGLVDCPSGLVNRASPPPGLAMQDPLPPGLARRCAGLAPPVSP